jgi:hypothetical protein
MAVNPANYYSATQEEKAAAKQRAAEVRKRLTKGTSEIEGASSPDDNFMIGQWMDARHGRIQSEDQYHSSASGKDPDLG